jgi:hypothetical protein
MRAFRIAVAAALLACGLSSSAGAVSLWNEGVDGELSSNGLAPSTASITSAGTWTLTGATGGGDRDYLAVSLGSGLQIASILLTNYVSSDAVSFIGAQAGATFTEPPAGTNVANLLGYTHFGTGMVGSNILDDICAGAGAAGCTPPLSGSDYSWWIQQLGSATSYSMDFIVVVPEPGTGLLAALGLGLLALARYSRRVIR